jgi:type I restriction enzyme R subunit
MIFFSQKILRKFYGDYTFLIVTDRKDWYEQIYNNFASVGAVTEAEVHAESSSHLKQLLKENHRNIFTLILLKSGQRMRKSIPSLTVRTSLS